MTTLTFEGVQVHIPSLEGVTFSFENGDLHLRFTTFTGEIKMQKPSTLERKADKPESLAPIFRTPSNKSNKVDSTQAAPDNAVQQCDHEFPLSGECESLSQAQCDPPSQWYENDAFSSQTKTEDDQVGQNRKRARLSRSGQTQHMQNHAVAKIKAAAAKNTDPSWCSISPVAKETAEQIKGVSKKDCQHDATRTQSGAALEARWGHTATMIGPTQMVVYGGEANEENKNLGDVHIYNLSESHWSKPINCESLPRTWHSATYLEEKNILLVFGGERNIAGTPEVLADIMVLDTEIFLWYPPAVSGKPPSPRAGHSASLIHQEGSALVVVFGGVRGRKWQNSLHVLDTERWHWNQPRIAGIAPPARCYHSATVANEGSCIVIFGGNDGDTSFNSVEVLQLTNEGEEAGASSCKSWSWFKPHVVGHGPCARTGHIAVLVAPHIILVYGGWDPQSDDVVGNAGPEVFEDAFLLNTLTWEWSSAPNPSLEINGERTPAMGYERRRAPAGSTKESGSGVASDNKLIQGAGRRVGHSAVALMAIDNATHAQNNVQTSKTQRTRHRTTVFYFGGQDEQGDRHSDLRRQMINT